MKKLMFLIAVICCFSTPAKALTLPANGQEAVPSHATAPFIMAGSICDAQRTNLHEYIHMVDKTDNPSSCPGQAIYVKKSFLQYSVLSVLLLAVVYLVYRGRRKRRKFYIFKA